MANKLASELLKELGESGSDERKVTTTLDAATMKIIEKYRRGKSIKQTVEKLIAVADEYLHEQQHKQAAS
ncbi:MAG: hypothetical protein IT445_06225 [Phycisphaeraceae bacterium]|nr:hypothetical protein [Phycisphaeraceae bacterium]